MEVKPLLPPVTVNGVTLDPGRIADEAQNHPAPKGKPGHAWKSAARALAIRELLLQRGKTVGIAADPTETAPGQWETEEEALIRQVLDQEVVPEPADEARLRTIYDTHPERFRAPSLFEAAHILLAAAPEDPVARAMALQAAEGLLQTVQAEPRRFAELAVQNSACSSKANGGVLGQLTSGDTVPEFEAMMASMKEGEFAICKSRYGIHVIRLDARADGAVLPFEAVMPQLVEAHEKAAWLRASRAYVDGLVGKAEIDGIDLKS
ncbi:peptidylprolyl isomerase [Paracoccus litorisediminis]|uniref:Parvulin-like PPIase n=1 Tax=Paracoccus litorisediminis TaxID=2006130 RepID=A0A844HN56_9RHOB|nr:peptidylprolyl isomerase [Paracoccus litorisediminis]MTH60519.1 peptidase [Paracoccus litorisediminis]